MTHLAEGSIVSARSRPRFAEVEEPFIITAMLSLLGGSLWMWLRHELFLQYFYFSELLALTHLLTLGFVTSLMMGVLVRLTPMSLGVAARSKRLVRIQFLLFFVGTSGMIFHFWMAEWSGMAWATLLVLAAAVIQMYNFSALWPLARAGDWVARYAAAALLALVLAGALGALLGLNKAIDKDFSFLPGPLSSNLFAHVHLAALGWVTNLIFGFQLKLVPTTRGDERFLPLRFWLLQVGTVGLTGTLLADIPGQAPFAAFIFAAVLWQAWGPVRAFFTARVREWELAPLLILVSVAGAGVLLSLGVPGVESPLQSRVQLAYGYLGLLGWIALTITMVAFKLFPVWVWQERFQSEFGKKPVPGMKELYSHHLRLVSNVLLTAGVLGTAVGILATSRAVLAVFPALVFFGILGFVANFIRMARWALLKLEYHPSEEEWRKFGQMFPGRD